jgi:hypothetical protein
VNSVMNLRVAQNVGKLLSCGVTRILSRTRLHNINYLISSARQVTQGAPRVQQSAEQLTRNMSRVTKLLPYTGLQENAIQNKVDYK